VLLGTVDTIRFKTFRLQGSVTLSLEKQEETRDMALARCATCRRPQGLKHNYIHPHDQISLPAKHLDFCRAKGCTRLAMIWLTDYEEEQYVQGVRDFQIAHRVGKVRIK